jgi:plasmid stabilization system protein ParE
LTPASFTPLALNDMKEAFDFYEAKDHELALKFMLSVRQTVDAIEKAPLRFPVVFEHVRKARVAKFPFVVSYVTDGESIIIACLHDRRNPKILLERLRTLGPGVT